jgi:pSer/pThr/pTyr-binding forkhead associated (FHA) protein
VADHRRVHARIDLVAGDWQILDLGSRNGIRLNGVRLSEAASLTRGDTLLIGTTVMLVE